VFNDEKEVKVLVKELNAASEPIPDTKANNMHPDKRI
jgi:hypothetical protein